MNAPSGTPRRSAFVLALMRAYHQSHDRPCLYEDSLAVAIAGPGTGLPLDATTDIFGQHARRMFIAAADRYTADQAAAAIAEGCRQVVILSTGLTTYAYRGDHHSDVRIFEVDQPEMLEWKRDRLAATGTVIPAGVRFVAVPAGLAGLACHLREAGFRNEEPAFFSWLSVVPVMPPDRVREVWKYIGEGPARIVFTYIDEVSQPASPETTPSVRFLHNVANASQVRIQNMRSPQDIHGELDQFGMPVVEDLDACALLNRYGVLTPPTQLPTEAHVLLAASRVT